MKKITMLVTILALVNVQMVQSQTVDEIINSYFENTGGVDNWGKLSGVKIVAKVNQGGIEIPLEIVQMKDGRQYTKFTLQGQVLKQGVYDGEVLWSTNFQTMKAEKSDDESIANAKLDTNDFPDSFFDYKKKGYTAELVGKEDFDGSETFKVKIVKEPRTIDGQKVEDITYYFFDTESFVPLGIESEIKQGPAKGQVMQIKQSEYQEVGGLYFPFSLSQGLKGGQSQPLKIEKIEVNPAVTEADFKFPNQ
ncbi:MAG: outer membrane lipoprotein-sorting protein [Cyclobacteriaceae bacterium]